MRGDLLEFQKLGYIEVSETASSTLTVELLCAGALLSSYFWSVLGSPSSPKLLVESGCDVPPATSRASSTLQRCIPRARRTWKQHVNFYMSWVPSFLVIRLKSLRFRPATFWQTRMLINDRQPVYVDSTRTFATWWSLLRLTAGPSLELTVATSNSPKLGLGPFTPHRPQAITAQGLNAKARLRRADRTQPQRTQEAI
ncbi:hypothetical protein L1887_59142 [Cichorium endivia]|nr:hypothetical protein L1887_59142 [Cichorium endivia]